MRLSQPSPALLMDQYHFLVGEFAKNSPFIPAAASAQLFAWFAQIGEPVERYGNKRGKIVKFSQRNYEKMLFAPDADSIGLLSPRIVPPDEQALRGAMQAHGRCEEHAGWIFWYLQPGEQEAARAALNAHAMLGAYINN